MAACNQPDSQLASQPGQLSSVLPVDTRRMTVLDGHAFGWGLFGGRGVAACHAWQSRVSLNKSREYFLHYCWSNGVCFYLLLLLGTLLLIHNAGDGSQVVSLEGQPALCVRDLVTITVLLWKCSLQRPAFAAGTYCDCLVGAKDSFWDVWSARLGRLKTSAWLVYENLIYVWHSLCVSSFAVPMDHVGPKRCAPMTSGIHTACAMNRAERMLVCGALLLGQCCWSHDNFGNLSSDAEEASLSYCVRVLW